MDFSSKSEINFQKFRVEFCPKTNANCKVFLQAFHELMAGAVAVLALFTLVSKNERNHESIGNDHIISGYVALHQTVHLLMAIIM